MTVARQKELAELALAGGAQRTAVVEVAEIPFRPEFREACEANVCGHYKTCWMCPPDVGEIDELIARVKSYRYAFVFQTVDPLEDSFDIEGMEAAARRHSDLMQALMGDAKRIFGDETITLGAGRCHVCERCARADEEPCRYPDKAVPSLEAHGIAVSELAALCGMNYINGQNTVTFFGAFLYRQEDGMNITATIIKDGNRKQMQAEAGLLLSQILGDSGHSLDLPCGGKGTCLRCAVRTAGALSPPSEPERRRFSQAELDGGMRLACQTRALGDVQVEAPSAGAFERILAGEQAAGAARAPLFTRYGVAADIGTTTLCVQLHGLDGLLQTATAKNPQTAFGADVISRIEQALAGRGAELAATIRTRLAEMIAALAAEQGIPVEQIDAAVLTGNTTMLYLLAGQNPEPLSHAPFAADRLFGEFVPAAELRLPLAAGAQVYLPRCMSAFVGADITAAVLAGSMCETEETALLADIGTNGEIALWHKGELLCCSTAAGPAFEGVGITHGVYGVQGAIDRVWLEDGRIRCSTIGGAPAVGICGSGVVDALAAMLEAGVIDETGAFQLEDDELELREGVFITAQDVRMAQLAKGSVRAGIETLLQTAGVEKQMVKRFLIAGGFGNYLDLQNAARIGLVPPELLPCAQAIGNAAQSGAALLLRERDTIVRAERLAQSARTVALDANPVFTDNYMRCMMFE